jgi:hypothetical protein
MRVVDVREALTGDKLLAAITHAKDQRKPIADGLLYEKTIVMVSAAPGVGKSTVSTQIALELAAGLPIFGALHVARPMKVLFAQTERPLLEALERIEILSKIIPIVKDNLVFTDAYNVFNLLKEDNVHTMIDCMKRDCPNPDVIFIDPIYALVSGGLSKDEPASAFAKGMTDIWKAFDCPAMYYNHHTSRPQYDIEGKQIEKDDPFYGSTWLKAHCTGAFFLKETAEGVKLINKKDNYRCLHSTIELNYDSETGYCSIPSSAIPNIDKLRTFLRVCKLEDKTFSFNDMVTNLGCDTRTLRRLLCHSSIAPYLLVVSTLRNKKLYKSVLS